MGEYRRANFRCGRKRPENVIDAYMNASAKGIAASLNVRMKNIKTSEIIKTNMIIAPIIYEGHIFVIEFFSHV